MRHFLVMVAVSLAASLCAQDRVFLLSGAKIEGKVTEIGEEIIVVQVHEKDEILNKIDVLLIHYANGLIEKFNEPEKDATFRPGVTKNVMPTRSAEPTALISANLIGIANADISGSYERLLFERKIGLGVLASINFNPHVNLIYAQSLANLSNCKKVGDLGGFVNFYPKKIKRKTITFYGFMVKWSPIRYTAMHEDTSSVNGSKGSVITYSDAKADVLAFMGSYGKHYVINDHMFVRTLFSLGWFGLHGEFRTQMNEGVARASSGSAPVVDAGAKATFYFSLSLGWLIQ